MNCILVCFWNNYLLRVVHSGKDIPICEDELVNVKTVLNFAQVFPPPKVLTLKNFICCHAKLNEVAGDIAKSNNCYILNKHLDYERDIVSTKVDVVLGFHDPRILAEDGVDAITEVWVLIYLVSIQLID